MKTCVTGHRPNKLYGYNLQDPRWLHLKDTFKKLLIGMHCTEGITGMALGADLVFAQAVLELKRDGYDIRLHCAIPCQNQTNNWSREYAALYQRILDHADRVKVLANSYSPAVMQARNRYMVDAADIVIAVWNGTPSGAVNCIRYAQKKDKPVYRIRPF